MKKYGFVYIWYDRKHKRYYIGCRWGKEDDGYICSSPWMKQGYKHRPQDFKRKILSKVYTNKKDLLEEEYRWLSMIKNEELGKKYYNLHNHHFGHWSSDENSRLSVGQKISAAPNRKDKIGKANKGKKPARHTIDATIAVRLGKTYEELYGEKRAKEIKEKQNKNRKRPIWTDEMRIEAGNRAKNHMIGRKASDETKRKMSGSHKLRYENQRKNNEEYL